MNYITKLAMIGMGYAVACLIAGGVVYVYQQLTNTAAAQASGGMYAFGDLLLFFGVFVILALFPTGLAIYYFLRAIGNS